MQTLPLALLLAEETETKFRAVHQLLVENQYEVLMVEAGARKTCTAHNPPVVGQNSGDDFWVSPKSSEINVQNYIEWCFYKPPCPCWKRLSQVGLFFVEFVNA